MKKYIFTIVYIITIFCFTETKAQSNPTLQKTFDWISGKVKTYAKRVGPPQETKNTYDFSILTNDKNEVVWIFDGDRHYDGQFVVYIFPMRITSFEVSDTYIQLNGTNILKVAFIYDSDISNYEIRKDTAIIVMDMNLEENFIERMKKALNAFISLKKRKAASGEEY